MSDSFDLSELFTDFRDEGRGQLGALDDALLRIERDGALPGDERDALLRALHTLKGNAGMLGLRPIQERVHALESVFKTDDFAFAPAAIDLLRRAAALLRRAVDRAGTEGQAEALAALEGMVLPSPAALRTEPSAAPQPAGASVDAARDASPGTAGTSGDEDAAAASPSSPGTDDLPGADELREEVLRIPFARLDTLLHRVGEMQQAVAALELWTGEVRDALEAAGLRRALAERVDALDAAAESVRRTAARLRTVSLSRLFGRFPALAADLARAQGKRVRVELEGEDTELDKSTVDALAEPLLHLVRNAVDHGIETPERRMAQGKEPEAVLRLSAAQEGDMVRIEVEDDGAGLDVDAITARARAIGLVDGVEDRDAAELIFAPGFSTRAEATELSGRGVGLDVVRTAVARLRGSVDAEPGENGGTRFVLRLPLTVALVPALFFESAGEVLALAASDVEGVTRVESLGRVGAAEVMEIRGEALPVIRPAGLFGWPQRDDAAPLAVIVRRGERGAAILADRLIDQRPTTLRPLPEALGAPAGVSGATVNVDGRAVLLLDAGGMMDLNVDFYRGALRGK